MRPANAILILAIAMAISMTSINAGTIDQEETFGGHEEVSRALHRLLVANKKPLTCDRDPRICVAKGSAGPFCCKKACVDVRTDPLNCGLCGRKCKYNETCCKGNCVNPAWDKKNCGRCSKSCGARNYCAFGLCNYA